MQLKLFLASLLFLKCFTIEAESETVVALHGFLANSSSMRAIRGALVYKGFSVYLWDYESRKKTIQEHACELNLLLAKMAACHPGKPIHFVAHSTGALILRAAVNLPSCPEEAKRGGAVLLAPPNQGSILARQFQNFWPIAFGMGKHSGWQLMHLTPEEMRCFGEFPPCMKILVVAGTRGTHLWFSEPNDGFITVAETRLNTPHCFESYPVAHGSLLTSKPVLCITTSFLCRARLMSEPDL